MYTYALVISLLCIVIFILLNKLSKLSKKINALEKNYSKFLDYSRDLAYSIKDIQDYLLSRDGHTSVSAQSFTDEVTPSRPPFFKSIVGEA